MTNILEHKFCSSPKIPNILFSIFHIFVVLQNFAIISKIQFLLPITKKMHMSSKSTKYKENQKINLE